jgi:hypothetical protein
MAACTPAGLRVRLSHYGAEGVDPLVIEYVELVPFIIFLVFGDLFCGICRESADRQEEFLDDVYQCDCGSGLRHC